MLQAIREHTQGWIAGIIISLIILSFSLWGIHSYFEGNSVSNEVAQVNGVGISKQQLVSAYERLRRRIQNEYKLEHPLTSAEQTILRKKALEALVDIEVLKQAANKGGFKVSDRQVNNFLERMPEFQEDGHFSVHRFQEVISTALLTPGEFINLLKYSLLIDQPKLGIILTSIAMPNEIATTISLINQERDIEFISIPLQYFSTQQVSISPEKVRAFYEQHQKEFMKPEQVQVEYISLSLNDLINSIVPSESNLKNIYNENLQSYKQPMMWKLQDVYIPLPANASSDEVIKAKNKALAVTQDLKNGKQVVGFDTKNIAQQGFLTLNQFPADLRKAVSTLTQVNQVSTPIQIPHGFSVLKVLEIKTPQIEPFERVKEKVKQSYVRQQAEEKFAELKDQLADLTYEHPNSLHEASEALNLPIQSSDWFSKESTGKGIAQYNNIRTAAFSNEVLNLRNNSDLIPAGNNTVVVLHIKSHTNASLIPLNEVAKQIEDKLRQQEINTQAEQLAKLLKSKLEFGISPQQLAAQYKLNLNKTGLIGRYSSKIDSAILDKAFRLPPANRNNKPANDIVKLPDGYAVITLLAVKDGQVTDKKQLEVFSEQIQNAQGVLEYELYKQSEINRSKIKIY